MINLGLCMVLRVQKRMWSIFNAKSDYQIQLLDPGFVKAAWDMVAMLRKQC
jgi:hypothetical protein